MRHTFLATALAVAAATAAMPAFAGLTPTKRVEPEYPREAAKDGTEGFVEVEFNVDPAGKVTSVSVVNAKPSRTFEQAAVRAVKQWEFAPGGGKGRVRLDFAL